LHVVVIADFAHPSGGAQKVALESARAVAEEGHDVTYIHSIGDEGDAVLDHPRIRRIGLGLDDIWQRPLPRALIEGVWYQQAALMLRNIVAALPSGPTILHLHQWTRGFSASLFPVLVQSGLPLVITLHEYFTACPNGLYYRFDQNAPCTLKPMSGACLVARCDPKSSLVKMVRVARSFLTRQAIGKNQIDVVHVSDISLKTLADFLPQSFIQHRVDNPVTIVQMPPASIEAGTKIAYVGRMTREKGADLVALAAKKANVPVLFIGEGPLEAEIRELNPDAEIIGWVSPAEAASLLRAKARAVAAPSLWFETGPLTVYEALAAGLPPIVSNRAGAAEKVRHGVTGFVVEPQCDALAEAFLQLSDNAFARRLGQAAYEHYWAHPLNAKAHADNIIALYDEILARA
jgi:glycosyltransferase involved in cell wall biosynthesis